VYNPFLSMMLLAFEAQKVIELRLVRLAWGGREGRDEMQSMVAEKIDAAMEAAGTLMTGGSRACGCQYKASDRRLRADP
jgi:hypothetical protein